MRIEKVKRLGGCLALLIGMLGLPMGAQAGSRGEPVDLHIQIHIENAERWVVRMPERTLGDFAGQRPSLIRSEGLSRSETAQGLDRQGGKRVIRPLIEGMGMERLFSFPASDRAHRIVIDLTGQTDLVRIIPGRLTEAKSHALGDRSLRYEGLVPPGAGQQLARFPTLLISTIANDQQRADLVSQLSAPARNPGFEALLGIRPAAAGALTANPQALFEELRNRIGLKISETRAPRPLHQPLRAADMVLTDGSANPIEAILLFHRLLEARGVLTDRLFTSVRRPFDKPDEALAAFDTALLRDRANGQYYWLAGDRLATSGNLPPEFSGRTAFLIEQDDARRTVIDIGRPINNRIEVSAKIEILRDGTIEGQSLTTAYGASGALLAHLADRLAEPATRDMAADLLEKQMLEGAARVGHVERATDHTSIHLGFRLNPTLESNDVLLVPGSPGPRLHRPALVDFLPAFQRDIPALLACRPIHLRQNIVLDLPDQRSLIEVPPDMLVKSTLGQFRSEYRLEGRRLTIERLIELDPPSAFCERELTLDLSPVLRAAGRDLSRMLHIRRIED